MLSSEGQNRAPGLAGKMLIGVFRAYQLTLSPVFYALGIRCRHLPTCSAYGIEVVRAQGLWRGGWLTFGRVCRCRPGGTHGYDPAPCHRNEAPWWAIWRFRAKPSVEEMNSLPPAGRADDKE